jgi:hypothetical protein
MVTDWLPDRDVRGEPDGEHLDIADASARVLDLLS